MEQELENRNEINQLKTELNILKDVVDNISILLNKKLLKELYKEYKNVKNGQYYTKEEFMKRHHLKSL